MCAGKYAIRIVSGFRHSARQGAARAILTISATLGAINLSRAVSDPNLSREILKRTRDELISLNKEDGAEKRQETR